MMSYTKVNQEDIEQSQGITLLREPIGCNNHGVSIVNCGPKWESPEHDHNHDDQEEVYLLIEGQATVVIDDEEIVMEPGDAVRIAPEATRQIVNGDEESLFVLTGASE